MELGKCPNWSPLTYARPWYRVPTAHRNPWKMMGAFAVVEISWNLKFLKNIIEKLEETWKMKFSVVKFSSFKMWQHLCSIVVPWEYFILQTLPTYIWGFCYLSLTKVLQISNPATCSVGVGIQKYAEAMFKRKYYIWKFAKTPLKYHGILSFTGKWEFWSYFSI